LVVQTIGVEFNLIDYYENSPKTNAFLYHDYSSEVNNYGRHNLPPMVAAETLSNITPESN